jgi:hypothetical protein
MTTYTHFTPQLTMAHIALGLDAPPAPPRQPPDPAQAVVVCEQYLERCHALMQYAHTPDQRSFAQFWIDNAERQLARWQAALARQGVQS